VIPVHPGHHRDVLARADSRGLPRLIIGFGRRRGNRSRSRGGGRLGVITLVSRAGGDALSWLRRRRRRGRRVVTLLVSHTSPIGYLGLPGAIRPGGWHDGIGPATTGLTTTGLTTTGLTTTGLTTTGLTTTGLTTTGLTTTGLTSLRGRAIRPRGQARLPCDRRLIRRPSRCRAGRPVRAGGGGGGGRLAPLALDRRRGGALLIGGRFPDVRTPGGGRGPGRAGGPWADGFTGRAGWRPGTGRRGTRRHGARR
jgi:hypothetical protein